MALARRPGSGRGRLRPGAVVAVAACAALAACTSRQEIEAARQVPFAGTAFDRALVQGYLDQAAFEAGQEDWHDADRYYRIALALLGGEAVAPQRLEERVIAVDVADPLATARAGLADVLVRGGTEFAPANAAMAQVAFDCWLEQQEEAHQPTHIAACRTAHERALARARDAIGGVVAVLLPSESDPATAIALTTDAGTATADRPLEATQARTDATPPTPPVTLRPQTVRVLFGEALAAHPDDPVDFLLYFEVGTSDLTAVSAARVPDVVAYALGRPVLSLRVVGHTDTVGAAPLNARLAVSRAERVRDLLVQAGAPAEAIEVFSLGESSLLIETPDNTAEPRNRRVVVTVR